MDGGEGHFAARLRKSGELYQNSFFENKNKADSKILDFYDSIFVDRPFGERIEVIKDKVIILPKNFDLPIRNWKSLGVLRAGVILGEIVKNRIEPHHSAFMAAKPEQCVRSVNLDCDSADIKAYLHGEEITVPENLRGYTAVCVNSMTTGFGKASNGRLKNKYPKGLRTLR